MIVGHFKSVGIKYTVLILGLTFLLLILSSSNALAADPSQISLISFKDGAIPDLGLAMNEGQSYIQKDGSLPQVNFVYGDQYAGKNSIVLKIIYFPDNTVVRQDLNHAGPYINNVILGGTKNTRVISTSIDKDRCSYMYSGHLDYLNNDYTFGYVIFADGNTEVTIEGSMTGYSDQQVQDMMAKVEAKAKELLAKGKPKITLVHYSPFSSQALSNKAKGGDIIATLTDKDGRPLAGKDVYFFLSADGKNGQANNNVIALPGLDLGLESYMNSYDSIRATEAAPLDFNVYKHVKTGQDGKASFNYFQDDSFNYNNMEKPLAEKGGIKYTLMAYVFDEPLENTRNALKEPKILAYASAPIEYTSMAVIAGIDQKDSPVRVIKSPDTFPGKSVNFEDLPFGINPGNIVMMPEGVSVKVVWISGERLSITPKSEYFKEGNMYAVFTIGSKDLGWTQKTTEAIKAFETIHLMATPVEILIAGEFTPVYHALEISGILYPVEKTIEKMAGPIEYEHVSEPLYVVPHSRILIDIGNTSAVYTLEGTATVYNKDGTSVNVTTGHKMNVTEEGTFSQISTFNDDQLTPDQKRLVAYAQESKDPGSSSSGGSPLGGLPCLGAIIPLMAVLVTVAIAVKKR